MRLTRRGWLVVGALALGCSARSGGGGPIVDDVATTNDTPTVDVPTLPDVPVTPPDDVPTSLPDKPATPDVMTVGGCYVEEAATPVCPAVRGVVEAARTTFRVTQLDVRSPASLASPILLNVINGAVRNGNFLWGMSFEAGASTFRTGPLAVATRGAVGQGLLDGAFRFTASNTGSFSTAGNRVTTTAVTGTVRLPIFDASGAMLTELPLDNVRVTATLATDRGCVGQGRVAGGRFNECTSAWATTDGQLNAAITVSAARTVNVSSLMTTLCNLLAGANCASAPQSSWPRQPDTTVNGQAAYSLTADFAATAATLR